MLIARDDAIVTRYTKQRADGRVRKGDLAVVADELCCRARRADQGLVDTLCARSSRATMNNSSHPDVPKPQCMKDTMLNGPGIDGMHPVKVASNAECANLCGLKSTCEGWVYNRYRNCYLKRQPIGHFAADDPLHGSVSCRVLQRPLCTLRNIRAAMPVGSRALRKYVRSVYGRGAWKHAVHSWNWSQIEYIHFRHLPLSLRTSCSWRISQPKQRGEIFRKDDFAALYSPPNSLWQYQHERLCTGDEASKGGPRTAPLVLAEGSWREVTHVYIKHSLERKAVYHYSARGSGLWYHTGKTLVVSDHYDLALYTNMTTAYDRLDASHGRGRGGPEGVSASCFNILRRRGFHTVIFDHHVDWAKADMTETGRCVHSYYVTEIINIRHEMVFGAVWYHFWSTGGDLCLRSLVLSGLCGGCLGYSAPIGPTTGVHVCCVSLFYKGASWHLTTRSEVAIGQSWLTCGRGKR